MAWNIVFDPLLPWWTIAAAGAAAALPLIYSLVRLRRGALLRVAVLGLLLAALANPSAIREEREPLTDVVAVIADHSPSQARAGRIAATDVAVERLRAELEGRPGIELRVRDAGAGARETRLFEELEAALADVPPERIAGAIFVTDGQVHDVPEGTQGLAGGAPIHTLLAGSEGEVDRKITLVHAPRYGIVGEAQTVRFRIDDESGGGAAPAAGEIPVELRVDGEVVERRTALAGPEIELDYVVRHGGANIVEIEVGPRAGELTEDNNRAVYTTQGIRDRLRVLLISGEPHAGERTWRNLLKADSAVDLVHFTILRPPEKQDGTPIDELSLIAFPTRELFSVKLNEFDLIIFDRYRRRGVLPLIYLDNVVEYVRQGGAVLAAAGPAFASMRSIHRSPLADILPAAPTGEIVETPFRARITDVGHRHPVTAGLPGSNVSDEEPAWGHWMRVIDAEPQSGAVVMSGPDDRPLMILDRVGEGRIALLLSDHAWLWARGFEGGGPQAELLRRLAHWLMKEPELEEEALRAEVKGDSLVITRRSLAEQVEAVTVTPPEGEPFEVTLNPAGPGSWQATIEAAVPGIYRLESGGLTAVGAAGAVDSKELADVIASPVPMTPVAEASGGGIYWAGSDAARVELPALRFVSEGRRASGSGWLGLKRRGAYVVTGSTGFSLMSGLVAAALILMVMGLTWYREGR